MNHDLTPQMQHGEICIQVNESWALRHWTRELGVTERELRETVEIVGPKLADVRKLLGAEKRRAASA
jgi:hypothetical protein